MIVMNEEAERLQHLIKEAISVLCRNATLYKNSVRVQGLLGITLDEQDVFLVDISDTYESCEQGIVEGAAYSDTTPVHASEDYISSIQLQATKEHENKRSLTKKRKLSQHTNSDGPTKNRLSVRTKGQQSQMQQKEKKLNSTLNFDIKIKEEPQDVDDNCDEPVETGGQEYDSQNTGNRWQEEQSAFHSQSTPPDAVDGQITVPLLTDSHILPMHEMARHLQMARAMDLSYDGPEPSSNKQPKKPRRELTLQEKVEIILEHERTKQSYRKMAILFKCGKGTVQHIMSHKQEILDAYMKCANTDAKRLGNRGHEEINDYVYQWYLGRKTNNMTVTGTMLQHKARQLGNQWGIPGFKASNGWLNSFRKRRSISFAKNHSAPTMVPASNEQHGILTSSCRHELGLTVPTSTSSQEEQACSRNNSEMESTDYADGNNMDSQEAHMANPVSDVVDGVPSNLSPS